MPVCKSDIEVKLGKNFVIDYLKGTELVDLCVPNGPDFTFLDKLGNPCALEIKRLSFPLTSEEFKGWSQSLMAKLVGLPMGMVPRLVVEWPDEDGDRLAWLEVNTEWITGWIAQVLSRGQWASVAWLSAGGFTTNHPTDGRLVELGLLPGTTPTLEVSFDGPGWINREDLLRKADHQLKWGRNQGMRCLFLAVAVVPEDRDQARQWLSDRLSDGSAYPHIDQAYVGWPDTLDDSGSTWVYDSAWKRD